MDCGRTTIIRDRAIILASLKKLAYTVSNESGVSLFSFLKPSPTSKKGTDGAP
jgi:hypothetical protein